MSGGKDSCYLLLDLCRRFPHLEKVAIMADTGFEHQRPISAEAFAQQVCAQFLVPLVVVRNQSKTYLSMVEKRGKFPAPGLRQCTSDLKRAPIETWIRRNCQPGERFHGKLIINCTGIRAQESSARAKQKPLTRNRSLTLKSKNRHVWNWMPIFRASLTDVLDGLEAANIPLHPVYSYRGNGGYLKRLSCRVCIFSTNADICAIHKHDPEAFNAVSALEEKMNFTMRSGESLKDIVAKHSNDKNAKQYGDEEDDAVPCSTL